MKPVFVHISKNAGTSIVRSAGNQIDSAGHQPARRWLRQNPTRGDATLFAVLRHPYDRVVSEYSFRRRRFDGGDTNAHLVELDRPFDEWVRDTYVEGRFRTRAFFQETGIGFNEFNMIGDQLIWFMPQVDWLCAEDGSMLVERLLRFDHLGEDWQAFCAEFRIEAPLAHVNASPAPPEVQERLDDEIRRVIFDHYRADFDRFDFAP